MTKLKLEHRSVVIDDVKPYPDNPRFGNVDAIAESLEAHGQFRPLVVQKSTGYVLAGNHTLIAAKRLEWKKIAVTYIDVDDEQAARIVLVDNRTSDLAHYDEPALAELLSSLGSFEATGYQDDDVSRLLANIDGNVPSFKPDEDPVPRLDKKVVHSCPACGHEF